MKYVLIILLLVLSSSAQSAEIYRCINTDGLVQFTEGPLPIDGLTDCKSVATYKPQSPKPNDWQYLGVYGNDEDSNMWMYKFFDEKRPADKLWVKVIYGKTSLIKESTTLYGFKCSTKQLQPLQYSTSDAKGAISTNTYVYPHRYANPGTTDEALLKIACKKPTK